MGLKLPNRKVLLGKPQLDAETINKSLLFEPLNNMVLDAYHQQGYFGGGFEDAHFEADNGSGKTAIVLKAPEYTRFMLYGRGPGKMPPVQAISGWCSKYGIEVSPWAVAMHIAKYGTKGNDFLTPIMPDILQYVNAQLAQLIQNQLLVNN